MCTKYIIKICLAFVFIFRMFYITSGQNNQVFEAETAVLYGTAEIATCDNALVGGNWVIGAGLLDLWRNPKTLVYDMTKEASQKQIVSIRILPRNIYAGKPAKLEVTGINEFDAETVDVNIKIQSGKGYVIFNKKSNLDFKNGISKLFETELNTLKLKGSYFIKVDVSDKNGKILTSNQQPFDVFAETQLIKSKLKFAVADPENSLIPFLDKQNIEFVVFHSDLNKDIPVFVGKANKKNPQYMKLAEEVSKSHIVSKHPIFDGLPTGEIMHGVYENVHPRVSMAKQKGEYIAGLIGYDHFPDQDIMLRHYNGPGEVWWAADVLETNFGKGKMLLSTLYLLENLGKDPVADKILYNMINFATKRK